MMLSAVLKIDSIFLISLLFVQSNTTNVCSQNAFNYCMIEINHDINVSIV